MLPEMFGAAGPDRFLALLAAAVLPGTGREPLLALHPDPGPDGYEVRLDDGTVVGLLAPRPVSTLF